MFLGKDLDQMIRRKTLRIPLDEIGDRLPSSQQEDFDGFLVRSLVRDDQPAAGLVAKRSIDIAAAALGLVVLSPILLARRSSSAYGRKP